MSDDRPHHARLAMVALGSLSEIGPGRLRQIHAADAAMDSWERILSGRPLQFRWWTPELGTRWSNEAVSLAPELLWQRHADRGVIVSLLGDDGYPVRLAADPRPPAVLFWLGTPVTDQPIVAVVGTRRASSYGREVATSLGGQLSAAGISIVSGLALGIDGAAHRGALQHGTPPIGVIAGGLDCVYPPQHRALFNEVAEAGWLMAEAPLGVRPSEWRFPARNRIVAAIADAVVVVESGAGGGSMHTVREAERRGIPVLAVPGPVGSAGSVGTNQLISEGCAPCRDADDVLVALGLAQRAAATASDVTSLGDVELEVLDRIGWSPISFERLIEQSGLPLGTAALAVAALGASGYIGLLGDMIERRR